MPTSVSWTRYKHTSTISKLATTKMDATNPPHYQKHPSGVECIEITRHMNFNRGNAMKYIWRAGEKDPNKTVEDLQKAIWYLNDEIKRLTI